jgi:hypothetical protein
LREHDATYCTASFLTTPRRDAAFTRVSPHRAISLDDG